MAISASLIAKGIAGTLALAAPVATSVYYKDNIYGLFVFEGSNHSAVSTEEINTKSKPEDGSWEVKQDTTTSDIKITYSGKECSVKLTGNSASSKLSSVETELNSKLKNTANLSENNKRYRRGILKKCGTNNSFSIDIGSSENVDFSNLFDLSSEELIDLESKELTTKTFNVTDVVDENKLTITVTVNYDNSEDSSVKECKIIGSAKNGETITSTNLNDSKESIKQSVEDKINSSGSDKESNRKNFLTTCKKSFNNEITRNLKAKENDSNKYEIENLSSIFAISN